MHTQNSIFCFMKNRFMWLSHVHFLETIQEFRKKDTAIKIRPKKYCRNIHTWLKCVGAKSIDQTCDWCKEIMTPFVSKISVRYQGALHPPMWYTRVFFTFSLQLDFETSNGEAMIIVSKKSPRHLPNPLWIK